jgi:hypothetical protein
LSGLISYSVFSCLGMLVSSWAPPKTCFHNILKRSFSLNCYVTKIIIPIFYHPFTV